MAGDALRLFEEFTLPAVSLAVAGAGIMELGAPGVPPMVFGNASFAWNDAWLAAAAAATAAAVMTGAVAIDPLEAVPTAAGVGPGAAAAAAIAGAPEALGTALA